MKIGRTVAAYIFLISFFLCHGKLYASQYDSMEEGPFRQPAGPVALRNQMPLYIFYLQMAPEKASVTDRNKFLINADYTASNITVSAFTPTGSIDLLPLYDIQVDMEVSRVTLDFRYGLYDGLEMGLEVPFISFSGGYLDDFIESFEDGIGARTPRSRERQGSYNYEYSFKFENKYLFNQQDPVEGIGDTVLSLKYQLLRDERWFLPNFSIRTAVKLPTGSKSDLLGSGKVDYGGGFLIDKGFFNNRLILYGGSNIVMIQKPSVLSDISLEPEIVSGMVALECFLTDRFSIIAQAIGNSTPYPYSGTNPLDNEAYDFILGCNYRLKEKSNILWHFSIAENISAASSPDVSFHTGLDWEF